MYTSALFRAMKLSQARKMRDGLLKGDSVMAQAWKELLDGRTGTNTPDVPAQPQDIVNEDPDARGAKTREMMRRQEEGF